MAKDIFNLRTWNFLQGDRAVEGILRDLPVHTTLVVRNQWLNVLATLAGIRDLAATGWREDGFCGRLKVPENALLHGLGPQPAEPVGFYRALLQGCGVAVGPQAPSREGEVLLLLNPTPAQVAAAAPEVLQQLIVALKQHQQVIVILPAGESLHPDLRPFARKSVTALHYSGLNALNHAPLEEVLSELAPAYLSIAGYPAASVVYTAIGAVDYFIVEDALYRNPNDLSASDLQDLGQRVRVLEAATAWPQQPPRPPTELLRQHLESVLGVTDTGPDPRVAPSAECIAIDIL
ncbi:MAG: hypothetical protein ACAI44_15920 [Candidatus Sericytochromatia bacterium]